MGFGSFRCKEGVASLKSQCGERVQRECKREKPWSTATTEIPSAEASPLISQQKKSFCQEESGLMYCKSRESSRIIAAKVTSLQDRNISPRTVAENQTELESSCRPEDRSRSKSVKDLRVRPLLEFRGFWDWVNVVLCSEGVAAGWTKGKTRNSVLYVRWTKNWREQSLCVRRR